MEFRCETLYDGKAFTAMAKVLRKTTRKKRSVRTHIFGWIVIVFALLISFVPNDEGRILDAGSVFTWVIIGVLIVSMIFEDHINGYIAKKRTLPGMEKVTALFREDGYSSLTALGNTEWNYGNIWEIAETKKYFVFLFSTNHAQLYDKTNLTGGSEEEFRRFLEKITDKKIQQVK